MRTSPLERPQAEVAGAILAQAFHQEPLSVYLVPEAAERAQALRAAFTGWVRSGRFVVDVCAAGDAILGVAVWSAPTGSVSSTVAGEQDNDVPDEVRSWSTPAQERFGAYFGYVSAVHRRLMPAPHWYLALLGVAPPQQGRGYGSALLRSRLAQADEAGQPCYLETGRERNVTLYRRHGFRVIETGTVPRTGVRFWALRRG